MNNINYELIKYTNNYFTAWDDFVLNISICGTIYNTRKFLSSHPEEKFEDTSIIIYKKSKVNKIICVVPCCKIQNEYFSHSGATYGGIIISQEINNIKYLTILIDMIFEYYDHNIKFRIADEIYCDKNMNVLMYLLNRKRELRMELSWYVDSDSKWYDNLESKRNQKYLEKFEKNVDNIINITVLEKDYIDFHEILRENLMKNHNVEPTHSLDEFLNLAKILKNEHRLYIARNKNIILGGVFLILTNQKCWYTFYISKNNNTPNDNCSCIAIMKKITMDALEKNVKCIDYGTSTENRGKDINIGLSIYKEQSYGGLPHNRYLFL
jgi:hypothetical protein